MTHPWLEKLATAGTIVLVAFYVVPSTILSQVTLIALAIASVWLVVDHR